MKKRGNLKKLVALLAAVPLLILGGAGILFSDELKIIRSIQRVEQGKPIYFMEIKGDYYFEDLLKSGGVSSDREVSAFLAKKISKGFYSINAKSVGPACSVLSGKTPEGGLIWGRNFDWKGSVPIIVKSLPENGYASISTSDFQNITSSPDVVPEGIANQMLSIAALYVPMDGVNEAGLCVADLQVNEGGMVAVDTDKPNLTVTTALRMLLNKAATVEEAIVRLKEYDIFASGGISHHIALSDASGKSVSVEFADGNIVAVDTNALTNFNLANGDTAAGGQSSKQRYEALNAIYEKNSGILTGEQMTEALSQTAQRGEDQSTQWSIVYEQASSLVTYYFDGDYAKPYRYSLSGS